MNQLMSSYPIVVRLTDANDLAEHEGVGSGAETAASLPSLPIGCEAMQSGATLSPAGRLR